MRTKHRIRSASIIAALVMAACTPTTTPPSGHIAGLTENRLCAGPVSPSGCTSPFNPASDEVTISRGTVLYLKLQSASNGVFTVDLPPGSYNFHASTNVIGGFGSCPVVPVDVVAGATIAVTLRCTIELP